MAFDAKSILDALVRGGSPPQAQQGGDLGGIGDLLRQLTGGQAGAPSGPRQATAPESPREAGPAPQGSGSLEDMLRNAFGGQQGAPGGGLDDILGKLQQQAGQSGGGILDVLKQVLGQATSGVREGAGRIDEATGASGHARDAIGQATGRSPEDLLAQLKELLANNRLGAGAALGGLGALILGTGTGRSLAASAVKLGGLALIGGLAYKAYQNYQQGQPPLTGGKATPPTQALLAAPDGSGFEAGAVTHDKAVLLVRAMIAAAAADGRIDPGEQQKIMGGLQQAGLDGAARQFLTGELNNPATVEDLAEGVSSEEDAVQVYTAARVAVDVDNNEEHDFLAALAQALGIDAKLAAQVDASVRGAAAR